MKSTTILVLLLCLIASSACSTVNRVLLVSSTTVMVCDWGQTRSHAESGWSRGQVELNPIMGERPTPAKVDAMFAINATVNTTLWAVLPKKLAWIAPAIITVAHTVAVASNYSEAGMCGVR